MGSDFTTGDKSKQQRTTEGVDYVHKSRDNIDLHVFDTEGIFSESLQYKVRENLEKTRKDMKKPLIREFAK